MRVTILALTLGEIALLFIQPPLGLALFWTVVVPCLPALWAIAPGPWRQVCPMAFLNQVPRLSGAGATRGLPPAAPYWSCLIGAGRLVEMVGLRRPLLNTTGWATGAMCASALLPALVAGILFKGRSGWCGTLCPLAPVQRTHGLAWPRSSLCATAIAKHASAVRGIA